MTLEQLALRAGKQIYWRRRGGDLRPDQRRPLERTGRRLNVLHHVHTVKQLRQWRVDGGGRRSWTIKIADDSKRSLAAATVDRTSDNSSTNSHIDVDGSR